MSNTTYDVRIWKTEVRKGKRRSSYHVRWIVAKRSFKSTFSTRALADSFRSKLVAAVSEGTAFDTQSGLPVTMSRAREQTNWFDFACAYVDMKWPHSSPKHRKSIADSLITLTMCLLTRSPTANGRTKLRKALRESFNLNMRESTTDRVEDLRWLRNNTRQVSALSNAETLRELLSCIERNQDGGRASVNTVRLRRTTLTNALDFAAEKKLLDSNPINDLRVRRPATTLSQVDRRTVPNPEQARSLLSAVSETRPHLRAFFSLMYFAALRPEEASNLRKQDLALPREGWGELHLERASPEVGEAWTDTRAREQRGLKHREEGTGRVVPCPPELTEILNNHVRTYGVTPEGRLFRGSRTGRQIGSSVYGRAWARARGQALNEETSRNTTLAKRPYDLRHAAVSMWLNAGVEPTRVAEWAGHSVSVLLRVYAKCLDQGEEAARNRVQQALGSWSNNTNRK